MMLVMHANLSSQVAQAWQAALDDAGDARKPVPSLLVIYANLSSQVAQATLDDGGDASLLVMRANLSSCPEPARLPPG